MNISQIIEVVDLLGLPYTIEESRTNLAYIEVILDYNAYQDKEITKTFYFNPKTGLVIHKYIERLKIKKYIKKLQEELKKLEEF